jgi:hypothetical protein
MERLRAVGLGHLALDLHGAAVSRKEIMKQFSESLRLIHGSLPVDDAITHDKFLDRRARLNRHVSRLHARRRPSGLSFFEMQGRLLRSGSSERSRVRWRGAELERISPKVAGEVTDLLAELAGFSGLLWKTDGSPWIGSRLPDGLTAQQAVDSVSRLRGATWTDLRNSIAAICADIGISEPKSLDQLKDLLALVDEVRSTLAVFKQDIFRRDLEFLKIALAPCQNPRARMLAWCFSREYRSARKTLAALHTTEKRTAAQLYNHLMLASAQLQHWNSMAPTAPIPAAPERAPRCRENLNEVLAVIAVLTPLLARGSSLTWH